MRLKEEQIKKLSRLIFNKLNEKQLIELRASEEKVKNKIEAIIIKNLKEEDQIDEEARKTMAAYRSQIDSGQMDERKLFLMIKKEIIKKRNFII